MKASLRSFLAALAPVLLLSATGIAQVPAQWSSGHGDIGVGYENEGSGFSLFPHWHIEGGTVNGTPRPDEEFEPSDLVVVVPDIAATQSSRQSGSQWDPIGVAAGETFRRIPQGSVAGVPFMGWATEELSEDDWVGPITFALSSLTGPGEVSIYHFPDGNLTFLWASFDGITGADAFPLDPGVHAHFNVAFSNTGTYAVGITMSGQHATDGLQTETGTFQFEVVPEPGSVLLLVAGLGVLAVRRRRQR